VIFEPAKKHLFLDISSTNNDTLVSSLYKCVETRSIKVFWLLSQPLPHLCFNLFVISKTFATQLWTALRDIHFPPYTRNISLWISYALSSSAHRKPNGMLLFCSMVTILTTETNLWTCYCASVSLTFLLWKIIVNTKNARAATYWYTQKIYYVHYNRFTSIFDLFTDSPSYLIPLIDFYADLLLIQSDFTNLLNTAHIAVHKGMNYGIMLNNNHIGKRLWQ
jgi:hypothetical protein